MTRGLWRTKIRDVSLDRSVNFVPLAAAVTCCWFCGPFQGRGTAWRLSARWPAALTGWLEGRKQFFVGCERQEAALALGAPYGVAPLRPDFWLRLTSGVIGWGASVELTTSDYTRVWFPWTALHASISSGVLRSTAESIPISRGARRQRDRQRGNRAKFTP